MTKDEITAWALANGWQMMDGFPSLTKPAAPHPAIVRLVLKATVAREKIRASKDEGNPPRRYQSQFGQRKAHPLCERKDSRRT